MELDKSTEPDNVVININGLSVWTREKKSWWRRRITQPCVPILNNISGCIREGDFVAVLGPSGAGKTSFLVCLAGKNRLPSRGSVTVRGQDVASTSGLAEIVPQFDVFLPGLTVMEHMLFMTELKLGSVTGTNKEMLDFLLKELNLKEIMHTSIKALSGGERRLLSLATSLLSEPQILICDEPTTGLDSYNALLVVQTLRKLCTYGKVVICSVHQPSTDLFREFTSIILMAEGRLLFHGSHESCKERFESLNLHCPKNYNPAEFYIRAISNLDSLDNVRRILEAREEEVLMTSFECDSEKRSMATYHVNTCKAGWFRQVYLLLWRTSLTTRRDIKGQLYQLLVYVVITSLIVGTCYAGNSGTTQRGVQNFKGLLWLMTSEVSFAISYNALYVFQEELPLFKREIGTYSCSSYFFSNFLCFLPRCIAWPFILVFLVTLAVQLPNHMVTATEFFAILSLASVTASAYGLGMAALFTSSGLIGDVMPSVDLPLLLMSGSFFRMSSLPSWLIPLRYVSHFYYTMDAVSNIYWRQIDHIECEMNSTSVCIKDGLSVLAESGYSENFVLQDLLGLISVAAGWSLLTYLGLKREERKGYVY